LLRERAPTLRTGDDPPRKRADFHHLTHHLALRFLPHRRCCWTTILNERLCLIRSLCLIISFLRSSPGTPASLFIAPAPACLPAPRASLRLADLPSHSFRLLSPSLTAFAAPRSAVRFLEILQTPAYTSTSRAPRPAEHTRKSRVLCCAVESTGRPVPYASKDWVPGRFCLKAPCTGLR
jgi:hypothetical protein